MKSGDIQRNAKMKEEKKKEIRRNLFKTLAFKKDWKSKIF